MTEQDGVTRDRESLTAADVVIVDASGSSYGVGFEVGYVRPYAWSRRPKWLLRQAIVARSTLPTGKAWKPRAANATRR